ncbi:hydrolase [Streptomyces lunaelactis]|uniref:Hydrolase n=1 Tax=Streptomyces lunaelactis TaxID=1535768 RepID=A0A2R4T8P5_9ACTN|nr:HAD family hydrolase [Streptomyces lunaelactis]AVZ75505.1 hydrolase [Streptomyces lunaelactis]NUK84851.1 HAD family hydrolase [Streptomyces lunaelactis]NUL03348.1 HAD family hydrolase [Streptomyces lunaelactis]
MTIRAVLWDIDDTIFDYTSADRVGMRQHLKAEGLPEGYESIGQALDSWREFTDVHWARFADGETDFEGQRRDRVRSFLRTELSDTDADAWFDRHVAHYEAAWSLFPDTVPVLDLLADEYRHAVLSNSSIHNQDRKLRVLGVRDRFEAVVCAVELGVSKPDPGAFHAACDTIGLAPQDVAYVGDHPEIDARGAVAAGLAGIWLDRTGLGGHPELTRITGLDQLPGLLRGDTRFGAPDTFR